jgi:hypothetical protein
MSYSHEEDDDLHECCAVNCDKPGTELLIMKSWTGSKYGGKESPSNNHPVASGYYCKNHMAVKLESLIRRYRSGGSSSSSDAGTAPDVNLAATTPQH